MLEFHGKTNWNSENVKKTHVVSLRIELESILNDVFVVCCTLQLQFWRNWKQTKLLNRMASAPGPHKETDLDVKARRGIITFYCVVVSVKWPGAILVWPLRIEVEKYREMFLTLKRQFSRPAWLSDHAHVYLQPILQFSQLSLYLSNNKFTGISSSVCPCFLLVLTSPEQGHEVV